MLLRKLPAPILDKLVPGIAEAMRMETFGKTPTAHFKPGSSRCQKEMFDRQYAGQS